MKHVFLAILMTSAIAICAQTPAVSAPITGTYFGQALPGETPALFAPAVLAQFGKFTENVEFSPDGNQCFIHIGTADYSGFSMVYSKRVNDVWTAFAPPPFIAEFEGAGEPVFLADGRSLMFTAQKKGGQTDLYTVSYSAEGWGKPVALPAPINSDKDEFRGSFMADGTLYFGSTREGGNNQTYRARKDGAKNWVVEKMGAPLNPSPYEGDPAVAPDGRFLVFYSGIGGKSTDLFVSFADGKGGWGTPVSLGVSSASDEFGAHLSADGKYLFFTRHSQTKGSTWWMAVSAIDKKKQ